VCAYIGLTIYIYRHICREQTLAKLTLSSKTTPEAVGVGLLGRLAKPSTVLYIYTYPSIKKKERGGGGIPTHSAKHLSLLVEADAELGECGGC